MEILICFRDLDDISEKLQKYHQVKVEAIGYSLDYKNYLFIDNNELLEIKVSDAFPTDFEGAFKYKPTIYIQWPNDGLKDGIYQSDISLSYESSFNYTSALGLCHRDSFEVILEPEGGTYNLKELYRTIEKDLK